jgi:hypothetical protein
MFLLLYLLCASAQAQTTLTLAPSHDAYVNDSAPTNNFNTSILVVGGSASEFRPLYRTYLRFNFGAIPASAVVTSAQLRLSVQAAEGSSTMSVEVRRALATWTATTIVWNTQPASSSAVATVNVSPTLGGTAVFNFASLVQGWVNGSTTNNGLVLQAASEVTTGQTRTFASNNHLTASLRPQLVVTYSLPADIVVSPLSLSFGNQIPGMASASKTVTLQNTGGLNLTVSSIGSSSGDFLIEGTPSLPAVITPGASTAFKARFKPLTTGIKSGSILIASNDTDEGTVTVSCAGTGVAPEIAVTPSSLLFAEQLVNTISASQTVRIKNEGTAALTITAIAGTAEFAVANIPALPASIASGAEVAFLARFVPSTAGIRHGTISISSSDADEDLVTLVCSGTGVLPRVTVAPASLAFGKQVVGTSSQPLTASVRNESAVQVLVNSIISGDDDFVLSTLPVFPVPIAAGGQLPFSVFYRPDSVKNDDGCINISVRISPDSVLVICVPAGGIGVGPQDDFPVIPEQMAYRWRGVAVNTLSASRAFIVRNPGTVARTITDIRIMNSSDPVPPFTLLNTVTLPVDIPGGGSLTLCDARFAPTAVRTSLAAIEVTTNTAVNPTLRVRLEGRSIDHSSSEFFADSRAYRVEFDKLKYADGDNIWLEFTPSSGHNPGSEATVYIVSPVQNDIERVTLRSSATASQDYGQVNRVTTSGIASSYFDGKLSALPGEFFFLFYQGPDALPTAGGTAADFAFMEGGTPRGLFSLSRDTSLTPKTPTVPGRPGETPRGLAAVAAAGSPVGIMGDDQIIIQPRDLTELNDFLHRYGGRVVDDGRRPGAGQFADRHFYLVRINPDSADLSDFAFTSELAGVRGNVRSSATDKTSRLYAILAQEQLESRRVSLNPRLSFFDRPSTVESANLLPGGAGGSDAFQLNYIRDCVQKVNRAWLYVAMQDRDRSAGTSVPLAIIDDGFCTNPDLSMVAGEGYDIAEDDNDPTGPRLTDDGLDWHGADVASAAASLLNDGVGSAGSGGQVADLMFYRLGGTDFVFEAGTAIDLAVANGAKVINMSFGLPCKVFGSPSFADYKDFGYWINIIFLCPFIDAVLELALGLVRPFLPVQPFFTCEALMATMAIARSRMESSVEDALAAGVSLVASAGNARADLGVPPSDIADFDVIPASFPGVIAVGEMDNTYTNTQFFGDRVDVWSMDPVRVFGPPAGANNCASAPVVRNFNGTSSSAGFISGVVCMMRAVNPDLTPAEVRGILRSLPPGPADATVQHALDAYAVVREAGARAGLPDLALTSASIGFDENRLPNEVCGAWPAHLYTTDDTPNSANVLPVDGSDFSDRGIHTFVAGGSIDPDNYVFQVPGGLAAGTAFDVSISTFFPTAAGAVLPHPEASIVELGGIFEGFSRATWQAYGLFLNDDLYFSVQGIAANLAERDNVYELTSRITQQVILADRYDRAPLGDPPNNIFADATHLPNAPGGDVYSYNDDAAMRVWQITPQNLNFHTPDDVDFFRLDLPDEAGDDCSSGIPDCPMPGLGALNNGLLEIMVRGARQIIAYDAKGTVLQQDENYLRYSCPRSWGSDIVYFEVIGSTTKSLEYAISITYSVPDPGVAQKLIDLCNAKKDPNSPDPYDADDSYSLINPAARQIQEFLFGAPCNPIVCDPPKHDYLVFNWKKDGAFSVEFEHPLNQTFRFQLRDNKLQLVGAAHPSGFTTKVSSAPDSALRQRIDVPSLAAGLYLLRADSAQIGSQYGVRFAALVDVEDDQSTPRVPTIYILEQNHPNPFNPTTTISYALPKASHVSLNVYNTLGEVVRELVKEEKPAGAYAHRWDASGLPSGIYFYRLKAGEFAQTRKMVYIR